MLPEPRIGRLLLQTLAKLEVERRPLEKELALGLLGESPATAM